MMFALDYEILRDVEANGRISLDLARQPKKVATLLDEERFRAGGNTMRHNVTVFLEDKEHDWQWRKGKFRYYTRIAERADVLVVYETSPTPVYEPADAPTPPKPGG